MASAVKHAAARGLLHGAPGFVAGSVQYEVILGSRADGESRTSTFDVHGYCVPPRGEVFPHLVGEIAGFDEPTHRFEEHRRRVLDPEANRGRGRVYDFTVYSIVRFFRLCLEGDPEALACLFVPRRHVLFSTALGEWVRDHRGELLHRDSWSRFARRADNHLREMRGEERRGPDGEKPGYDLERATRAVRLLAEAERILEDRDLELDPEPMASIRRGEWTFAALEQHVASRKLRLGESAARGELPTAPPTRRVKELLLDCLEEHYGSLEGALVHPDELSGALRQIRDIVGLVHSRLD